MRKGLFCLLILGLFVATSGWSSTVTVNKAGTGGAYTSINAALTAGGTHITITDSSTYEEDLVLGDISSITNPAITITSDKTGDQRPRITPLNPQAYQEAQNQRFHCVQVFAPNSRLSNLIFESDTGLACGCMGVIAEGVVVENCLFHPRAGTTGTLGSGTPLIFLGSQGLGGGDVTDGGRQCDNVIFRNCEINGAYPDQQAEPSGSYPGYASGGACGASQLVRMDIYSNDGATAKIIDVTFEDCLVRYSNDLHMFPTNRGEAGGQLIVYLKGCRMDACAKMSIRGRGACVVADHTIFTRTTQWNHGDGENAALAINADGNHVDNWGKATDCIFVNCGGAYAKKAYFGGINNHNAQGTLAVDHCTFHKCVTGVAAAGGDSTAGELTKTVVSNSIFHEIGYTGEGALDIAGLPIAATTPFDVPALGLYKAWYWGVYGSPATFDLSDRFSAVFNNPKSLEAAIEVQDCLVGTVADEAADTRLWADIVITGDPTDILACRLDTGVVGPTDQVRYLNALVRGTPIFVNTDPDAEIPYELTPNSPGQGWGARFGSSVVTEVSDWSLYR